MLSKNLILTGDSEDQHKLVETDNYKFGYFRVKNKTKSLNEDSLIISEKGDSILFAVADGAGGHPKGAEASRVAVETYTNFFDSEMGLIDTSIEANENVKALKVGARTTLICVKIEANMLQSVSVGDSEVIYWNSKLNEMYRNIPQSEVGYMIESGTIDQEESLDDPMRHYVLNLLGDKNIRMETTSKIELKNGHLILLGSDGLFDNFSHDQLKDIIEKTDFEEGFKKLCEICNEQDPTTWKKDDDISFIFIKKVK
jgi:serine/threonine protein phosphatase PrpC